MASRGLVIGKFYPPHRGHKFLIDTASAQVDHLTVVVCGKDSQAIPARLRAAWLREIHPQVEVIEIVDTLGDDDSPGWAAHTREFLGYTPDVVFTSEDYGDAYAHHLGCRHVLVDKARAGAGLRDGRARTPVGKLGLPGTQRPRLLREARRHLRGRVQRHHHIGPGAGGAV